MALKKYNVRPLIDWGTLPLERIAYWTINKYVPRLLPLLSTLSYLFSQPTVCPLSVFFIFILVTNVHCQVKMKTQLSSHYVCCTGNTHPPTYLSNNLHAICIACPSFPPSFPYRCDLHLAHKRLIAVPLSSCLNSEFKLKDHRAQIKQHLKRSSSSSSSSSGSGDADAEELRRSESYFTLPLTLTPKSSSDPNSLLNLSPQLPLISILAATTTRKITAPSTGNLALFKLLLPSLMRTLDCGFRYEYVLGFDQGDSFYDSKEVRAVSNHLSFLIIIIVYSILNILISFLFIFSLSHFTPFFH